jgi:hypothetical protein
MSDGVRRGEIPGVLLKKKRLSAFTSQIKRGRCRSLSTMPKKRRIFRRKITIYADTGVDMVLNTHRLPLPKEIMENGKRPYGRACGHDGTGGDPRILSS